jgi:anti-anti-sigma factor
MTGRPPSYSGPIDEMTLEPAGSSERWFDADSANLAGARQFVADAAPADMAEGDLMLSVSELVTNALLHGRTRFRVRVTTGPQVVRVEVFDANPLLPTAKNYGPSAITGRGLRIVEHLTSDWGVTPVEGGKWVWFEMARPAAPATPPLVMVAFLSLPVAVHGRAAAHQDALQREFDLLRATGDPHDVPARLLALVDELEDRYGGLNDRPTADLAAALDRGDESIDLWVEAPPDSAESLARLGDLLDEADAYCREGVALMTLTTPLESLLYRRWVIGQFVDQIGGAEAQSWPAWLAGQDTVPAPAPAARVAGVAGHAGDGDHAGGEPPVVRPSGDLDARGAPPVRDDLQRLRLAGAGRATLDLSDVTFIDSFGISVILTAHARFSEDGARLDVLVPPKLRPTFDLAGLETVLHMRPTPA